ncbi:sigma-70 family RNA polymerase sigma factor [Puniceicoccales bacterium CK1056]|uniref:Sigma-70 family RNA polymerase sigma factor n=2 Tax=Oceanipulchritudo coccoides TaxID=2706888 RepID=A0A6B2M0W0_9BACT|nr:sigma-70 family RNA polymerase sigma factor [Oceanipulchritudo coccoides]
MDPDQRIAAEVINGNHQAYNQLIERYWGRIFARVYNLLGNREDAEEVTQDAFSRALENLPNFRWEASFSTWLYQIASNLARNRYWYWKRRGRGSDVHMEAPLNEEGLTLQDLIPDTSADPADRMRWQEFHGAVNAQLDSLPDRHREIMELRLLDELSYEEISKLLEVPVGTVKSRIARARFYLTKGLGIKKGENVQAYAHELARGRQ